MVVGLKLANNSYTLVPCCNVDISLPQTMWFVEHLLDYSRNVGEVIFGESESPSVLTPPPLVPPPLPSTETG